MTSAAERVAGEIEAQLRAVGIPERALNERRYLRSDLQFAGATVPQTRRVVDAWRRAHPGLGHDEVVALASALWRQPVHERRMAAVMVLVRCAHVLGPGDLPLVERLLRESRTWALVDGLAPGVVGPLLAEHPDIEATLEDWAADPDLWIRRSALLAHLPRLRAGGDLGAFGGYADALLEDREFFVRKAIGWVLRESSKTRPEQVTAWLAPRVHRASGVTVREAVKYLPLQDAERIRLAHRQRGSADA